MFIVWTSREQTARGLSGIGEAPHIMQSKAKRALQEIWMAETKKDALAAFDVFAPLCACRKFQQPGPDLTPAAPPAKYPIHR
jgi:hypothetical protein